MSPIGNIVKNTRGLTVRTAREKQNFLVVKLKSKEFISEVRGGLKVHE